jgi:ribosomal protein S18 acetylase RimI-like enzyme
VRWRTFYRVFLLRNWTLAFAIVARRLFDLKRWRRLFETSRYAATATLPEAEFLSMAVLPRARGSGMSDALVRHLLDEFAGRGVTQVRVTTAFSNQASARVFERTGFRWLEDVEIHPGEVARIYVITLGEAGRTA